MTLPMSMIMVTQMRRHRYWEEFMDPKRKSISETIGDHRLPGDCVSTTGRLPSNLDKLERLGVPDLPEVDLGVWEYVLLNT
jgi:hypothetical protein